MWLACALPCWIALAAIVAHWASLEHSEGACGIEPCAILLDLAMIRFGVPFATLASAAIVVSQWFAARRSRL